MKERLKTVILILLSLNTLFLIWQTWAYEPALMDAFPPGGWTQSGAPSENAAEKPELTAASYPVQIAQKRDGAWQGALWDNLSVEYAMQLLSRALGEALGSAGSPQPTEPEDWIGALKNDSVYLRYTGAVPIQALAAWCSAECTISANIRRLALCAEQDSLRLYYEDDSGRSFTCDTASRPELPELGLGVECFFAFERDGAFERPEPLTLLPEELPAPPMLSVSDCPDMISAAAPLLRALGMDPETPSRYESPDGTVSFVDFRRQCRVSPDGHIYYNDPVSGENLLSPRTEPDILGYIEGTRALCASISGTLGEANWELQSVSRSGQTVTLRYGVQIGGRPIMGGSRAYALFSVIGGHVEEAHIYVKSYRKLDASSVLLPLKQGLAAASLNRGFSVELGYPDEGQSEMAAGWILGG